MTLTAGDPKLKADSRFFDSLVDAVPAKYYLHLDEGRVNLRFVKRGERERLRAQFKQQHKQARRAKLDPAQAKTTLQLQREMAEREAAERETALAAQAAAGAADAAGLEDGRAQLRARLQQKLEGMRKQRKADESADKEQEAKQWREKALAKGRKQVQKRQLQQTLAAPAAGAARLAEPPAKRPHEDLSLTFTKLEFGAGEGKDKRRRLSKQQLLKDAEAKKQLGSTPEGQAQLEKEAWKAALARSKGDKVLDDPRLLKKSIKKDARVKVKSAKAWTDRNKAQAGQQEAKQQRRRENIGARVTAKADKKKAKREKKLLRAGFEGRKAGFIATPKK